MDSHDVSAFQNGGGHRRQAAVKSLPNRRRVAGGVGEDAADEGFA